MSTSDSPSPHGIYGRIAALKVGETESFSERFVQGFTSGEDLAKAFEKLRNKANPAVRYAKAANEGAEYTVESGDFRTRSYDIIICVAITRTK